MCDSYLHCDFSVFSNKNPTECVFSKDNEDVSSYNYTVGEFDENLLVCEPMNIFVFLKSTCPIRQMKKYENQCLLNKSETIHTFHRELYNVSADVSAPVKSEVGFNNVSVQNLTRYVEVTDRRPWTAFRLRKSSGY
jgi:hypothetical protein